MRFAIAFLIALVVVLPVPAEAASWFGTRNHEHTGDGQGGAVVAPSTLGDVNIGGYISPYYFSGTYHYFRSATCTPGTDCIVDFYTTSSDALTQLTRELINDNSSAPYWARYSLMHGASHRWHAENDSGTTIEVLECDPDWATNTDNWSMCTVNDGAEYVITGNSQSLKADYPIVNNDTTYETVVSMGLPTGLYKYEFFGMFTANNATPGMDLSVNSSGGTVDFEYGRLECIDNTTGVVHLETYPNAVAEQNLPNEPDTYCHGMGTVEVSIATTLRLQMRQAVSSANAIQAQEGVTITALRVGE